MTELVCTYGIDAGNRACYSELVVLRVNDDCACEKHASELAQLAGIRWRSIDAIKILKIRELLWTKRPKWFTDINNCKQTIRVIKTIREILDE